ncbi:ribonuclease H [candidate division WWE3 bacterium CG08_land_8_20_14_0_20_43_13]|uniref:Ribonuclease H n=1 Tax=candidate division WWE3 bacterium CG08_land_8_20_14_0_20_43_13 TaxID=1975087 RepID=A0A2H0X7E0_UNCKA|nr:MAG: ribonuclease H [candidate division WWE3 bacterium CG08_land_8_20_14_0_20_43_13]
MYSSLDLYTDGGSRSNPGPAAIGGVLLEGGKVLAEFSHYIGNATNNIAEYKALIAGLKLAQGKTENLRVFLDSQLVVRQLNGEYRVKEPHLKPLAKEILSLIQSYSSATLTHVPREENKRADTLVNKALDAYSG